jgi:hypothetical protein
MDVMKDEMDHGWEECNDSEGEDDKKLPANNPQEHKMV